jgi:hypothetical protein
VGGWLLLLMMAAFVFAAFVLVSLAVIVCLGIKQSRSHRAE